jgi:hypothetical protein
MLVRKAADDEARRAASRGVAGSAGENSAGVRGAEARRSSDRATTPRLNAHVVD